MAKDAARACRDRFLDALQSLTGQHVTLQRRDGSRVEGVFHTVSTTKSAEFRVVLKASRQQDGVASGYSTAVFSSDDVVQVIVSSVTLREGPPTAAGGSFATDADIAGNSAQHLMGRDLKQVDESWLDAKLADGSLDTVEARRSKQKWDQFKANEAITGRAATFDEDLYTTKLDPAKISRAMAVQAEQMAKEIEGDTTHDGNVHVAQERGQQVDTGTLDEEDLYSGVLTADGKARSGPTPPSTAAPGTDKAKKSGSAADEADGKKAAAKTDKPKNGEPAKKKKSSLNPNAKSFTFNPNATSWTPSTAPTAPSAPAAPAAPEGGAPPPFMAGGAPPPGGFPMGLMPAPQIRQSQPMPYRGAHDGDYSSSQGFDELQQQQQQQQQQMQMQYSMGPYGTAMPHYAAAMPYGVLPPRGGVGLGQQGVHVYGAHLRPPAVYGSAPYVPGDPQAGAYPQYFAGGVLPRGAQGHGGGDGTFDDGSGSGKGKRRNVKKGKGGNGGGRSAAPLPPSQPAPPQAPPEPSSPAPASPQPPEPAPRASK